MVGYFKFDTIITYEIKSDSSSEYPAITVCNLNPVDISASDFNREYLKNVYISNNLSLRVDAGNDSAFYAVRLYNDLQKSAITANKTLNKTMQYNLGFALDDMLISCFFDGNKCSSNDFYWYRTNDYGNCFIFNSYFSDATSTTTKNSGLRSGLNLEIYTGM